MRSKWCTVSFCGNLAVVRCHRNILSTSRIVFVPLFARLHTPTCSICRVRGRLAKSGGQLCGTSVDIKMFSIPLWSSVASNHLLEQVSALNMRVCVCATLFLLLPVYMWRQKLAGRDVAAASMLSCCAETISSSLISRLFFISANSVDMLFEKNRFHVLLIYRPIRECIVALLPLFRKSGKVSRILLSEKPQSRQICVVSDVLLWQWKYGAALRLNLFFLLELHLFCMSDVQHFFALVFLV